MAIRPRPYIGLPMFASAGTAAAPGVQIGQTDLGLYRSAADRLGVAVNGLHWGHFDYQTLFTANDGAVFAPGRAQHWDTSGGEAYVATIAIPDQTMTHGSAFVAMNIGIVNLTVTTSGTVTGHVGGNEGDKIEIRQTGGAVSLARTWGWRQRGPIPKTGVTATNAYDWTASHTNDSEVTGVITNNAKMYFPDAGAPAVVATNGTMAVRLGAGYAAHLNTDSGVDLKFRPAAGRTLNFPLPTSAAGLSTGDWWANSGVVTIV